MAPKKVIPERDPDQAIEDWLNLTGLLYEQHKETLRVQTIEDELRDVHKKPQIDAESKHICRHDNRDVLLRMKQKDRELNTKKDQLRARKADKEPQYSFHPTISKHALAKNRKNQYQINTDWAEARKKRINAEKEKVQADEEKENQKEFEVSGRSRSLANKMERGGMSIEDWLIATDKQKKMKLWYMLEQEEKSPRNPKITAVAASLKREGPVGDRLHASAKRDQPPPDDAAHSHPKSPRAGAGLRSSQTQTPGAPYEDLLLEKWKENRAKFEAKVQEMEEQERARHHPQINAVSKELAESLPSSSKDRLQGKVVKAAESRKASVQPEPSFCPALCAKSLEIEESKEAQMLALQGHFSDSRLDVWQAKERLRQDKTERLKLEQEAKIMRECTFTPSKSKWHGLKAEQAQQNWISEVATRTHVWQQKKEEKIRSMKREKEKLETEGCTFQPNLTPDGPKPSNGGPVSVYDLVGFEEFMARKQMAKKKELETHSQVPGSKWTPHITIPQEFSLSYQDKTVSPDHEWAAQQRHLRSRPPQPDPLSSGADRWAVPYFAWTGPVVGAAEGPPAPAPHWPAAGADPTTPPNPPATPFTPYTPYDPHSESSGLGSLASQRPDARYCTADGHVYPHHSPQDPFVDASAASFVPPAVHETGPILPYADSALEESPYAEAVRKYEEYAALRGRVLARTADLGPGPAEERPALLATALAEHAAPAPAAAPPPMLSTLMEAYAASPAHHTVYGAPDSTSTGLSRDALAALAACSPRSPAASAGETRAYMGSEGGGSFIMDTHARILAEMQHATGVREAAGAISG